MPKVAVQTVDQCPYRKVRFVAPAPYSHIEERFDFQFGENGKLERVSLGDFDTAKEVNSHIDEVGLINVLKLAEGRGISLDTFAKTEPGLMADVEEINTYDDLLKAKADADAKLSAIAKEYGITLDQLIGLAQSGKLNTLEKPTETTEEEKGE